MKLLLVRHGKAEDLKEFNAPVDDEKRELTPEGYLEIEQSAKVFRTVLPNVEVILSSPLIRAKQTATLIQQVYGCDIIELDELRWERNPLRFIQWLARREYKKVIAVGHEPFMSVAAAQVVGCSSQGFIEFKKGAGLLTQFPDKVAAGEGYIKWYATPKLMRALNLFS